MKEKMKIAHMRAARVYGDLSYCKRRRVGCVIVEILPNGIDNIISIGYNGTDPGQPNQCEDCDGLTLPTVKHAEFNALEKLQFRAPGCHLFVTYEPCVSCAQQIMTSGITNVYYCDVREEGTYNGIQKLIDNGIVVERIQV